MIKKILLFLFLITFCFSHELEPYNRKYFGGWIDQNRDCQNTRTEVLINESIVPAIMDSTGCKVIAGLWYDIFSDTLLYSPDGVDVDHVVPLADAWESGAWLWPKRDRKEFANYLEDKDHLIAISASANRSKGRKAPHQWMPKNKKIHKEYLRWWVKIKRKWGLSMSETEATYIKFKLYGEEIEYPRLRHRHYE